MDFIGSKQKLNKWIFSHINKCIHNRAIERPIVFLDACAGSGSSSFYAVDSGFSVISNDIMEFPAHIIRGGTGIHPDMVPVVRGHIQTMNGLPGTSGFFSQHYCAGVGRPYMTDVNAAKLDSCRMYIDTIQNEVIRSYLIHCTMEAFSRASNTTGVQAAFLKQLKDRAKMDLVIREEKHVYSENVEVYSSDILTLLNDPEFRSTHNETILYIDPPYNNRQYGPNYHLYETLARYDDPEIKTKVAGLRDWQNESKSDFCSKVKWKDFTKSVIESTTAEAIFISYSRNGLLPLEEIVELVLDNGLGSMSVHFEAYKRYRSDKSESSRKFDDTFHYEYLIEVIPNRD